jgi:aspartate aminotransferase
MRLSEFSEAMSVSSIVELSKKIREKRANNEVVYDYSVGDFDPDIFPLPDLLREKIKDSYDNKHSNYPEPRGNRNLRESISLYMKQRHKVDYDANQILVAAGGRPLIYALFRILLDKDDEVVYSVPSWSNFHYTEMLRAKHRILVTSPDTYFQPDLQELRSAIKTARVLALCSPGNPSGMPIKEADLVQICTMVIEENRKRKECDKKLYIMFDQVYCELLHHDKHCNPISLIPEITEYAIVIDAISKSFAATGIRVGWCCGPQHILDAMESFITHMGAWAPNPEQYGVSTFLRSSEYIDTYLNEVRERLYRRQLLIYNTVRTLAAEGYNVDVLTPKGSLYVPVKLDLTGKSTSSGTLLQLENDVSTFLLDEVGLGLVPFTAFGFDPESHWYRISIGKNSESDLQSMLVNLKNALHSLK